MTVLEELEQEIYDENIEIVEYDKIEEPSMITKDKENYVTIVINKKKIKSECELVMFLSHEFSHHETRGYYHPYMLKSYKWKMERTADVSSVKRLVPIKRLRQMLFDGWGYSRFDMAEEFCVTEDFIDKSIHIYQQLNMLPQW